MARRHSATSKPDIPGMQTSRTMMSGASDLAASSAAWPLLAVPTMTQSRVSTLTARASIAWLSSTSSTLIGVDSGSDDVVLDGILDEFRARLDPELLHHPILVERDGSRREVQQGTNLFHRSPLGEQLQDFPLPGGQLATSRAALPVHEGAH